MKKIIYLLIGSLILVSCKLKEEKAETQAGQPKEIYGFKVTAGVISKLLMIFVYFIPKTVQLTLAKAWFGYLFQENKNCN